MINEQSKKGKESSLCGFRILWQKLKEGKGQILRMYGMTPQVFVPAQIEGHEITEIAPYCFAPTAHFPKDAKIEEACLGCGASGGFLQELAGNAIEEAVFPDTIRRIGNYAFYNCRKLKTISIGAAADEVGSDAFMNAFSLHRIVLNCPADAKSGIRQVLSQISASLEVWFLQEGIIQAALLYPEYRESYDEIAPAHLFGRNITGEGFRARCAFCDGIVDFSGYDGIFLQACAKEEAATLLKMALNRLRYPYCLREEKRELYRAYIKSHSMEAAACLTKEKDLDQLQFLCREGLMDGMSLAECIRIAASLDWIEGAAALLQMQAFFLREKKKSRYDFDM